jgi:high-affinity iron transporter
MPNYFNPAAFFVILRETLETVIVISILLRFVDKATLDCKNPKVKPKLKRDIWIGTSMGLIISIIIGIIFTVIFYVIKTELFKAPAEQLFEGIMYTVAVCVLTWLALSMADMTKLETKWEKKIATATAATTIAEFNKIGYSFLFLAFTIVFREGIESVVFITGVGAADPVSLAIPGILGLIVGIIIGYIIYRTTAKINMKAFLIASSAMILIIAAGIASTTAHEFEEYYHYVTYGNDDGIPLLWNTSACCSEKTNGFFAILQALTGYRAKVSVATLTTYFVYWALVLMALVGLHIRAMKKNAKMVHNDAYDRKMMENDSEPSRNANA